MRSLCIITSTKNSSAHLQECIDSVESLRIKISNIINVYHLFSDAGSTDSTLRIIEQNKSHFLKLVSLSDISIYDAWNKSLTVAFSQIENPFMFLFLGSDDVLLDDAYDFVIQSYYLFYLGFNLTSGFAYYGASLDDKLMRIGSKLNKFLLFKSMQIANSSTIYHASLFSGSLFSLDFKICSDLDFLLCHKSDLKYSFLPYTPSFMRSGGLSSGHSIAPINESLCIKICHLHFNPVYLVLAISSYLYAITVYCGMNILHLLRG